MTKFLSGKTKIIGQGIGRDVPITLSPAPYIGSIIYGNDGIMYYSDGVVWREFDGL